MATLTLAILSTEMRWHRYVEQHAPHYYPDVVTQNGQKGECETKET